jgi:hypothetical protein
MVKDGSVRDVDLFRVELLGRVPFLVEDDFKDELFDLEVDRLVVEDEVVEVKGVVVGGADIDTHRCVTHKGNIKSLFRVC